MNQWEIKNISPVNFLFFSHFPAPPQSLRITMNRNVLPDHTHSSSISVKCFAGWLLCSTKSSPQAQRCKRTDEEMPAFGSSCKAPTSHGSLFSGHPPLLTPTHFLFNSPNSYSKKRTVLVHRLHSLPYIDHHWTRRIHPKHVSLKNKKIQQCQA